MSLRLPLASSRLRELFDVADLVDWKQLPLFRQTLNGAVAYLQAEPGARAVHSLCIRADCHIWLIKVGPKGGWERLWDFGDPTKSPC